MVSPSEWGKYFWTCLHLTALGYPETPSFEEREIYHKFMTLFGKILPCSKCRINFERHILELPIDVYLFSRQQLFDWTVQMHNIVNRELGKPEWTYEQAWEYYTKTLFLKQNNHQSSLQKYDYNIPLLMLNTILLIVLAIAILYMFIKKKHGR